MKKKSVINPHIKKEKSVFKINPGEKTSRKIRRFILKLILYLILIISSLTFLIYVVFTHVIAGYVPGVPTLVFYILGLLALGIVAGSTGLLFSKKWGFWVYLGFTAAIAAFYIYGGTNIFIALGGFIGPLIIFLLLLPFWKQLK